MAKYRKLPVVIEAFRLGTDMIPDWAYTDKVKHAYSFDTLKRFAVIKTLEGEMRADEGDYIIKGINGELYPCKPDIFEKTYEKVEEQKQ